MKFEITKENKKEIKTLLVMHLLNGGAVFSVDRDNGRIVEITGFSMKTRHFNWKYDGNKNSSTCWTVSVGETYAYTKGDLFDTRAQIIAKKMR